MVPQIIADYFAAANAGEIDEACACFAPIATVHDEGGTHVGQAAIREWISDTTQKYAPQTEVHSSTESAGKHLVVASVSGPFPGSPLELDFAFGLKDGLIAELSIQ